MAYNTSPRRVQHQYSPDRNSPLRQTSNASTDSSAYSGYSHPSVPSRTSTVASSNGSFSYYSPQGHKRGYSEAQMAPERKDHASADSSPSNAYRSIRESLRPLPQAPNDAPPSRDLDPRSPPRKKLTAIFEPPLQSEPPPTFAATKGRHGHSLSASLGRSDSLSRSSRPRGHGDSVHGGQQQSVFSPDLTELQHSSTGHLRTLSRLNQDSAAEDFSISSHTPSVVGLQGRRQLKRNDSVRGDGRGHAPSKSEGGSSWTSSRWMDQQRQFLQAYEYLCHIGEAKEWIEDVIHKPIPPIVQLEEALRDGVTLAEVVQTLNPHRQIRIFHNPKLQYRHSDNIAAFFRYLNEVELPELFRFELIDLYEKKNIPKVIHCIHALSWLLYRNGVVDFRIGNLVGQLQFEHHELEEMQKGLDKSGINMPSFSGMGASFGAEPEPEPIETEEERTARELGEHEMSIVELQAQIRGSLQRNRLGQLMQTLWESEDWLLDLQSRLRGDWARQISDYRLTMKRFATNLQSAARGFNVRMRQEQSEAAWRGQEDKVIALQSLFRAYKARDSYLATKQEMRNENAGIRQLQAAIRGALRRRCFNDQQREVRHMQGGVEKIQASIRGVLERRRGQEQAAALRYLQPSIITLQAAVRASALRSQQARDQQMLKQNAPVWRSLQAVSRAMLARREVRTTQASLKSHQPSFINIQGAIRGNAIRHKMQTLRADLAQTSEAAIKLQSMMRGFVHRKQVGDDLAELDTHSMRFTMLQAASRGYLERESKSALREELASHSTEVTRLQGLIRAMLQRINIGNLLSDLDDAEEAIEELQAQARGMLVRARFAEKQRFFKENMEKVIKVQSFMRGKMQGEAYKSLTSGKNPPVGTVKNFVHLLNDSDFDFDEEVEFERLRKTVVQHVRQNELADQYISQLDIKIALLVKNKITLDEVVKHQKHFGGSVGGFLTNAEMASKDPFDLKALNKTSRRKLEHYQELFFILQTQPQYLARMFRRAREQTIPEKECERMKHLVMGLFGYAQKRREEYYLLKLITRSIREEIDSCNSVKDYLRGNFVFTRAFGAYIKSPRDRKFMRDLFGPLIKENILDNAELDLESDPLQIYHKAIENEQLRTGQRSRRRLDVSREEAIKDPETKRMFIANLQDLRDLVDLFFSALEEMLHKMPFGVRYVAQQTFESLTSKFQYDDKGHVLQVAGQWMWKNYLQPALLEPERFGAIDRPLQGEQKRNVGEVSKVINQIAVGRLFGNEELFLQPLNSYISESFGRMADIWSTLLDVPNAETQFDIDEFNDLYAKTKPTLYIKMADIFAIHTMVSAEISHIATAPDDMLRDVVRELGSAKVNENELRSVSSSEICLTLNPKLHDVEDPDAEVKALMMETKRCILYIIRVQAGQNLMEVMVKPITAEDEERWRALVRDELSANSRRRGAYADANTLVDIAAMTYSELKRTALENILRLEQLGRLSRHNHYQDVLNVIALDIRTKHRRRVQRARELEGVKMTLARLNDQAGYLDQQLKTYNDYIEQAMVTLQNKKGKKRFLLPFTKQWDHERELQRTGRVPKFGSYKYSAQELANRGILVAWQGVGEGAWAAHDLTLSSNDVGVFAIEGSSGSIAIPGATAQVPLDDLLQAQYNGTHFLEFFGGEKIKVNVNLFLHLIMRKFYKDRDH